MKIIGILLVIVGTVGIAMGAMMYGDIGIAAIIGATSALLSGIGFLIKTSKEKRIKQAGGLE
ncbi:hypothetical protein [Paenibacillus sp. IITD108]|uniref:hypothetical protein n=1 Tax=Paenibacillus sp. IITD108 TaxID=3116649 RepID=UPI002F3F6FC3